MFEAMAAANALLRLKEDEKIDDVRLSLFQNLELENAN